MKTILENSKGYQVVISETKNGTYIVSGYEKEYLTLSGAIKRGRIVLRNL